MPKNAFAKARVTGLMDLETKGYVSMKSLEILFNLFYWVYYEEDVERTVSNIKMLEFLDQFDLDKFKIDSPLQSAVVFYNKLTRLVDLRSFETFKIDTTKTSNKKMSGDSFKFSNLYKMYEDSNSDLTDDFLMFNDIFKSVEVSDVRPIRALSEVVKTVSFVDLIRPDFSLKIAEKTLNTKFDEDNEEEEPAFLYVIQDSTFSMNAYKDSMCMIKGFILNEALKKGYTIKWVEVADRILKEELLTKDNIETVTFPTIYKSTELDFLKVLQDPMFSNKKVVIITDGTDTFKIPHGLRAETLSVISFTNNLKLKRNVLKHGKFYRVAI